MNGKLTDSEWIKKGNEHLHKEEFKEALKCFQTAINLNSNNAVAWFKKGVVLHQQKKFDDAYECYDRALILDPSLEEAEEKRVDLILDAGATKFDEDEIDMEEEFLRSEQSPEEWKRYNKKRILREINNTIIFQIMGILFFLAAIISFVIFIISFRYAEFIGTPDFGSLVSGLLNTLAGATWVALARKLGAIAQFLRDYVPENKSEESKSS